MWSRKRGARRVWLPSSRHMELYCTCTLFCRTDGCTAHFKSDLSSNGTQSAPRCGFCVCGRLWCVFPSFTNEQRNSRFPRRRAGLVQVAAFASTPLGDISARNGLMLGASRCDVGLGRRAASADECHRSLRPIYTACDQCCAPGHLQGQERDVARRDRGCHVVPRRPVLASSLGCAQGDTHGSRRRRGRGEGRRSHR